MRRKRRVTKDATQVEVEERKTTKKNSEKEKRCSSSRMMRRERQEREERTISVRSLDLIEAKIESIVQRREFGNLKTRLLNLTRHTL